MLKLFYKYKILIVVLLLLFIIFRTILFLSPVFTIVNHTDDDIVYSNLQIDENREDPTAEEMENYGVYYKSNTVRLFQRNWFNENITLSLTFYKDNYIKLKTVNFISHSNKEKQNAYCAYTIDIYPNDQFTVTPTRKGWCIRSLYFNKILDWQNVNGDK